MKHILTGVAVVAALAFSAPAWAQPAPGQGGFGPKASGGTYIPPSKAPAAMAPSAGATATSAPPPATPSAPPPSRHAHHKMTAPHHGKGPLLTESTADQLNQQELARVQAGNMAPPAPGMAPPPPRPGRATGTTPGEPPYPGYHGPKASGHGG
jgi:hypothetical protein